MKIPFPGKFSGIKQYIRENHTHGVSKYGRGAFDVYSGAKEQKENLGVVGGAVFRLASTLPADKSLKVFAENFFHTN